MELLKIDYTHLDKTDKQLRSWFSAKVRENKIGNMDFETFKDWYLTTERKCHYCGLLESESQQIVRNGKLISKRFPQNGKHGRGTSRGMWLEIDRYNPSGKYEIDNIVPCCYFCNNDKSDVFHGDDYKKFIKNRIGFLKQLFIFLFILLTTSCSTLDTDTLSENEAKQLVVEKFQLESPDLVEIVEFVKIDGVKQEVFGQKIYIMNYHIKLNFLQNAHQFFLAHEGVSFHSDSDMKNKDNYNDYNHYKKGETMEFDDKNTFEKTENGWNY